MKQVLQVKNYLADNERKVNNVLRWIPLVFLILCPAIFVAEMAGVVKLSSVTMIIICVFIVGSCVFPLIYSYNTIAEDNIRRVIMVMIEFYICVIAITGILDVTMCYLLVPLLSLLYVDKALYVYTVRNCFISMLLVKVGNFFYQTQRAARLKEVYTANYLPFVSAVIEYILFAFVLYYLLQKIIEILEVGYQIGVANQEIAQVETTQKSELVEEVYNTKGVFLDIMHRVDAMTQGQLKKIHYVIDDELPSQFKGDTEKIKLAIVNVLSDYIQYMDKGELFFNVTYEKGITPKKGQSVTVVCKISCQQNLSEQFRNGAALGLALCKNLVQKLDGVIINKSGGNPYETTYVISFRQTVEVSDSILQMRGARKREQDLLISQSRKKAENLMYVKAGKALIVDDNEMNQRLVSAILKSYGLDSVCASNAKEAVEAVQTKEFNLVILDYMMPVKGGLQIAKEIRQLDEAYYSELPMIIMTSNNTEEAKAMFYENKFAEVISKPIKENELRLAIALCMCL